MIRQLIKIDNLPFVVDLFDAYQDNVVHYDQFVMFRNYEIVNDIFIDKDLYFVDKNVWDDPDKRINLIWPICEELGGGFSDNYKYYNGLFSEYGLNNELDVYLLYNKFRHIANVRCNKIRIYRPTVKRYNDFIIHIDNFINNIHMHYLCKKYESCEIHSTEEFTLNNIVYSEYIEFYAPNVYDLFDNDILNNHIGCYFKENLNVIDTTNIRSEMLFIDNEENKIMFPLDILSLPSTIEQREFLTEDDERVSYNIKKYHYVPKSIENNYLTYPVNIILWPFETELINDKYVQDTMFNIGSSTFMSDLSFTLSANLGFNNNKVSIISKFIFPNREHFEELYNDRAVYNAYMIYNNVKSEHYKNFTNEGVEKYMEELQHTDITDDDAIIVKEFFKYKHNVNVDVSDAKVLKEKYIEMKLESLYEELKEVRNIDINFIGFRILISSDINFKHIIYDTNIKIDFDDLDDFAFNLNDIFETWNNVYDGYYMAKIFFIDRLLGIEIISNSVMISPEWVKFMVKSSNERILNFDNINNEYINNLNTDDMTNFNCIENIKCIINKKGEEKTEITKTNNSPRLLYRPLFYRASGLQNVQIRRNIKQKIGINLSEFMTKVETFKLLLNGNEYIEYGRNDAFVIFEISGNNFATTAGMYDILNQDDEYISSGRYTII